METLIVSSQGSVGMDSEIILNEKRYALRKMVRFLSCLGDRYKCSAAVKYFIIVHNFLFLETMFKDEFMASGLDIGKHFFVGANTGNYSIISLRSYYERIYHVDHPIRRNIEDSSRLDSVFKFFNCLSKTEKEDFYSKFLIGSEKERIMFKYLNSLKTNKEV